MLNKSKIFNYLHRWGRHCLHCGGYFVQESLFCKSCQEILWLRHSKTYLTYVDDIPVSNLFIWEPDHDRQLSKLLKTLKTGALEKGFKYYAQEFLMKENPHIPENSVFIPCPGQRPDHAWVLARQFSLLLDVDLQDILLAERGEGGHQKSKNKNERSERRFSCQKTMAHKHVIFIDDIVTTGSTVRAAKQAIGPCQSFQVWALAQRVVSLRPSC